VLYQGELDYTALRVAVGHYAARDNAGLGRIVSNRTGLCCGPVVFCTVLRHCDGIEDGEAEDELPPQNMMP
jgi:hypothetical protein